MGYKKNGTRKFAQKAIKVIENFVAKYPNGIDDVNSIDEESQAWIERSIQIIRENVKHIWFPNGKPKWFESLRGSRNTTSHQTEFADKKTFEPLCKKFCSSVSDILRDVCAILPKQKTTSKKKRKFENFAPSSAFGSESDRKQLIDAMEDMASPVEPTEIKIEFPQNNYAKLAEKTFSEILDHDGIKDYIQ